MLPALALVVALSPDAKLVEPAADDAPISVEATSPIEVDAPMEPVTVDAPAPEPSTSPAAEVAPVDEGTPVDLAAAADEPAPADERTPDVAVAVSVSTAEQPDASKQAQRPKKPKPSPEQRLAQLDQRRIAVAMGLRGYGRFLDGDPASGAGVELALGVRLVRGLYVRGKLDAGAHLLPVGVAARGFVGLRHELRMTKWARPMWSIGYSYQLEANFHTEVGFDEGLYVGGVSELASRNGVEAGLGIRFPFRKAPRLSLYLAADTAYYFDDRPGRLQGGGSLGFSMVF